MRRLIDANKLKMYIDTCQFCEKCPNMAFMCQRSCEFPNILTPQWERAIDEQPTVDAVPVRHGKWLDPETLKRPWFRHHIFECSVCRNILDMDGVNAGRGDANYCPNCGADMRGEDNE